MATKLLLVKDVEDLGRSGDIVSVKPGYARNFLLPQGLAHIADKRAVRMQEKLQEERRLRAVEEKKEAEKLAEAMKGLVIETETKVDQMGHMYGSVTVVDIVSMLKDQHKIEIEKRTVQLKHPIKALGEHAIELRLQEEVEASIKLVIKGEGGVEVALEAAEKPAEPQAEEASEEEAPSEES